MRIYHEVWQTPDNKCLGIAFTEHEMREMPEHYRTEKRRAVAEYHGFDLENASKIRDAWFMTDKEMS